ncbi:MAG: thioredoxin domain-containing protein [Deltaproteobacteria bacterium]|nr:thioredoxin domain-containing protein [Deltaproteobacteria bacterium]
MPQASRPNRLSSATSPYLRQHADNPVDWHQWGEEALAKARREDKPIFLSIGYSTCHWCHVMAHECFEDPAIAAVMNEHFVNIKLDREERPDLDETYMNAVTALTGRGGWPLSLFLTPDLKPFYGGTYFPPEDRGGLPGFPRLLLAMSQAYRRNREQIAELGNKIIDHLRLVGEMPGGGGEPDRKELGHAVQRLFLDFDTVHGGLGKAPKFPRSLELSFLLHYYRLSREPKVLEMLAFTLEKMARGGIYDQLGGGFARYAVDEAWVAPHFEKMLYDNALLAPLYLAVYQLTGKPFFRRIAGETLDFALTDMQNPPGGFYAAWDADSEGVEGKYYVWSYSEFGQVVGRENLDLAAAALGVTSPGNFEGANILTRPYSREELAAHFSLPPEEMQEKLDKIFHSLGQVRARRIKPHRDEKVIVSWNGLMISALARGFQVLGNPEYRAAAARAARFILKEMLRDDTLHRIWSGGRVAVPGLSEDYAALANALLDLYEADFDPHWIAQARRLMELMDEHFLDPADGLYYYVAKSQETPLVRSKSVFDQTIPSGNSLAARVLLRLHRLTEETRYQERALGIIRRLQEQAQANPWGFGYLWLAQTIYLTPPLDLTLVGDPGGAALKALLAGANRYFLPERRLVVKNPADCAALEGLVPAARHYTLEEGEAVAYVCRAMTCFPGISNPQELEKKLEEVSSEQ